MREQLKLLEALQSHDACLQEFETARRTLPEKVELLKNDLARMEALLEKERQGLAETERFRHDQETQLKVDEGNIAKAKSKLQQVRTGRDYMAAQREIEATRRIVSERTEESVKLIDAIEATRKTVASHEEDVAKLRAHVEQEAEAVRARLAELEAKAANDRAAREALASQVRPDLRKRYETIRMRRGVAVVPVVSGVCQGCHMSIPPQLFNTLQRANSLESCPTCNRLIYWDELLKEKKLEEGEAGPPEAPTPPSAE